MKLNRTLIFVLYAMATLMIVIPLGETLLSVWPPRPYDPAWRFGAFGMLTRAIMSPLLGFVLLGVLAFLLRHPRTLRLVAALTGLSALLLIGGLGLFALDAIQTRAQVVPEAKLAFDLATVTAMTKIIAAIVLGFAMAAGGWTAGRDGAHSTRRSREAHLPLVSRT